MSSSTWTPHAVASEARRWRGSIWRIVESQYIAATMKLVDDVDEQGVLESIIEAGKPALPRAVQTLHFLLATPFRYLPPHGSRFRGVGDPGVFYGAQDVRTAAAEVGYWRWRFLREAVDLERLPPVAHTAFSVEVAASLVDLTVAPFDRDAPRWEHPGDYTDTQRLARAARDAKLGAIRYRSVRAPVRAWCVAVLAPAAFAKPEPHPLQETWFLAVGRQQVAWRSSVAALMFPMDRWLAPD